MPNAISIQDFSTGSSAQIAASLGFNCFDFKARIGDQMVSVLDAPDDFLDGNSKPTRYGIPILFPFPNRIQLGKFQWDGQDYELPLNGPHGNAIHGFCLDREWRIVEQSESKVTGEFQLSVDAADRTGLWPADYILRVSYEVAGSTLHSEIEIENPDSKDLPWGFGTHAYFRLPLGTGSDPKSIQVQAPVTKEWVLADFLPTGDINPISDSANLQAGKPFGELNLDDVLTGLPTDSKTITCGLIDESAGLRMTQSFPSDLFRELVAFTPEGRDAVCLEPYTCVTDAINLQSKGIDAGWQTLSPGETIKTWIDLSVESI